MKVYVASHFAEKELSRKIREQLQANGHVCTSRWLDEEPATDPADHEFRQKVALMDVDDVISGDVLVFRNPPESQKKGTGGRRVEFGIAVAYGKPILILGGPSETVFDDLPNVTICPDMESVLGKLREIERDWIARKSAGTFFDEYQDWTVVTSQYPGVNTGSPAAVHYNVVGMIGELGETVWIWLKRVVDTPFPNRDLKSRLMRLYLEVVRIAREAEDLKRPIRDGVLTGFPEKWDPPLTAAELNKALDEGGDQGWYFGRYFVELGVKLSNVFKTNVVKLMRRLKESQIRDGKAEREALKKEVA